MTCAVPGCEASEWVSVGDPGRRTPLCRRHYECSLEMEEGRLVALTELRGRGFRSTRRVTMDYAEGGP